MFTLSVQVYCRFFYFIYFIFYCSCSC